MSKTLPPLNWFRSFEAAARTLSFTAAADEVGLTQSAVSQQIKSLELRLGTRLFNRHPRGLSLTDEGRQLLPEVEAALETLSVATARYTTAPRNPNLTVAASISVIEWLIAPRLPDFRRAHPDAKISFTSTIWPDEFRAPRADIEVRFGSEKQVGKGAIALPRRLVPLKSPDLHGDVRDLPLIEAVGVSVGWKSWGQKAGITDLQPTFFVDSYGLALRLAVEGNGLALANCAIAEQALRSGRLVQAHDLSVPGKEGYFLSVNHQSDLATDFAEWLQSLIAE